MPRKMATAARSATRLPDGRAAEARGGREGAREGLMGLQRAAGNSAVGRLLAAGPRVGRADDAAEGAADRHAAAAGEGRRAKGARVGLGGAPRLGGGRALPGHLMRSFAPHFRSDLRGVRLHTGREVDHAARAMRAEAFTYGRDVFVRSDKYDPHTRSGKALLRHELAHVDADRGRGRTLRRKTGLPDAAEATREGGTSGLGFMGKGEWGTYRGRLDKFRAVSETNTKRQAALLLKLMDSSNKILASGYNASKKTFVRAQVPKIKKLYYQVALKADVFDAIESDARDRDTEARQLLDDGIRARMARLKKKKQSAAWGKLDPEERKKVKGHQLSVPMPTAPTGDALLGRLSRAKITMNFPPSALKFFIADSNVQQFWSLESDKLPDGTRKGPDYAKSRDKAEVMMGYGSMYETGGGTKALLRSHRPISCGVNITENAKGAAAHYGRWHFRLKDAVKTRATYLSGDSMDKVNARMMTYGDKREQHMGTQDYLSSVLTSNPYVFDALVMMETGTDDLGSDSSTSLWRDGDWGSVTRQIAKDEYIEVQVHGGISIDDIEALVVDVPQSKTQRTTEEHKAEGATVDQWKAKYKSQARVEYI